MITASEAGLTSDQWNALKAAHTDAVYQVIAHRWLPQFSIDHTTAAASVGDDFASIVHDDNLYRIAHEVVEYNDGSWHTVAGYSLPTGMTSTPYSLISDTDLFVFALTTSGIALRSYDGSSWSSWSTIVSDSTITSMSAVTSDRVHYVVRDNANNRYNFKVAEWDGMTWNLTVSEIYWPYPIFSFDAKNFNGKDVLVISTEVPGALSAKFINNQIVKYTLRSGGIFGFTFQYGSWSDHFAIENLDQLTQWVYRNNVRLSVVNNKLWLSCYASIGDEVSALTFYRCFTSKDGLHWSRGEYFPVDPAERNGFNLTLLNDTIYAVFRTITQTATSTLMFDHSPSSQQLDVSDEVLTLRVERQDMQQIDLVVDNNTHWVEDSLIDGTNEAMLQLFLGYTLSGTDVTILVGTFEVDAVTPAEDLPTTQLEITGRDWLSWMSGKTQAETFRYWEPQTTSGDEFVDTTGTGYGGMTNTAIQTGSWITNANTLRLIDNESEGIVYNVILSDDTTWNAMIETLFDLSKLADNEYAGLMFRAQDKDNAFFVFYHQSDDKIYLTHRVAGISTTLWMSSTKSWSSSLNPRYLRVDFYYCRIRIYSSSDGITWILDGNVLVVGKPLGTSIAPDGRILDTDAFPQSGFVGLIGKGFSDEGGWTNDPGTFPPAIFQENFYYTLPGPLSTPFKFYGAGPHIVSTLTAGITVYRLQLDDTGAGDWESFPIAYSPNIPSFLGITYTVLKGISNPFNSDQKLIMSAERIYKTNIWDVSPTFTLVKRADDVFPYTGPSGFTTIFLDFAMSSLREGFILATGRTIHLTDGSGNGALVAYSLDGGATWTWTTIFALSSLGAFEQIAMSGWDGVIYLRFLAEIVGGGGGHVSCLVKSADWGLTWSIIHLYDTVDFITPTDDLRQIYSVVCPYYQIDGSPNLNGAFLYAIGFSQAHTHVATFCSFDGGITWSYIANLPTAQGDSLYVHPRNANFLAYARSSTDTLYYSKNGGQNWTSIAMSDGESNDHVSGWPYSETFLAVAHYNSVSDSKSLYTEDLSTIVHLEDPPNSNITTNTSEAIVFIEASL